MLARQKNKTTRIAGFAAGVAAAAGLALATPAANALPAGYNPDAVVIGGIETAYNAGGGAETYGEPVANEAVAPALDGTVAQSFEKDGKLYGTFYWTPEHGAHFVKADSGIGAAYIAEGQQAVMSHTLHEYGAPVSEEICDGAAVEGREPHCAQVFENATISWTESEGATVTFHG